MTNLSPVLIEVPPDHGDAGQNGVRYPDKGAWCVRKSHWGLKTSLIAQLPDAPANTDCYRGSRGQ